jgi:hypothetical protein
VDTKLSCERRVAQLAAALAILGMLAGCGGGGGGGGGGFIAPGPGFTYPSSLAAATSQDTIQGASGAYSRDGAVMTTIPQGSNQGLVTVGLNTPTAGSTTFSVSAIGVEPGFSFSINITNPPVGFNPDTVAGASRPGVTPAVACTNCFRTGQLAANPSGNVSFTYLDLAAAGLTYSTLGFWERNSVNAGSTQIGGAFAYGVVTRGVDLPTTGNATYSGPFVGRYAGQANGTPAAAVYTVGAAATAQADFATRTVGFSTTGSMRTPLGALPGAAVADPLLNLSGIMKYSAGVNGMSSALAGGVPASSQTGAGSYLMSGEVAARFMGPPGATAPFAPPELAGAVAVKSATGDQSMVGAFALKKQ